MKSKTLARMLLELADEKHLEIAEKLHITPTMLSRVANGIVKSRTDVMERLASFFSKQLGVGVDSNILSTPVEPKVLVAVALHLRSARLTGGTQV